VLERTELMELAKRMLAHVENGTTDQTDELMEVPVSEYADADRWQAEMDVIFKRVPLALTLTCELRDPGAFKAIDVLGVPVLVSRGADGVARSFLNVCRHRGAALVDPGCGSARRFTCPYHAWSYDQRGRLVGIYGEETYGSLDRDTHGLTALPTAERGGFVFTVLTPGAPLDIDAWLGDYAEELDKLDLASWHVFSRRELVGAGWKVCYDGYLEGYHFASLHRNTIFTQTMSNVMATDAYGPHQRIVFAKHSLPELRELPEDQWVPQQHIGPVYTIFPHVSIAGCWGDQAMVSQLFPGPTHDRSRTIQTIITRRPLTTDDERSKAESYTDFMYDVVRDEDYKTGLDIQKGLDCGANTHFTFGRNELTLQRFHGWVERLMAEGEGDLEGDTAR
jgi:phenylpropionate dioxygenase-like ring-hydroxylating dioxygenase large terminal subunit